MAKSGEKGRKEKGDGKKNYMQVKIHILVLEGPNLNPELKIGTPVSQGIGNVQTSFGFLCLFVFELGARDRQTDGRTDGRTRPILRPTTTATLYEDATQLCLRQGDSIAGNTRLLPVRPSVRLSVCLSSSVRCGCEQVARDASPVASSSGLAWPTCRAYVNCCCR